MCIIDSVYSGRLHENEKLDDLYAVFNDNPPVSYTHLDVYKRQPLLKYQHILLAATFHVLWKTAIKG